MRILSGTGVLLEESGVVRVDLDYTRVSEGEKRAVKEICEKNKTKREQAQAEGPDPEPEPQPQVLHQPQADDELTVFLSSCGLEKYAAVMAAQGITMQLLPQLDDASLGLLGFNIGEKMTFQQVLYLYCLRCRRWILNMVFCSMSPLNINQLPLPSNINPVLLPFNINQLPLPSNINPVLLPFNIIQLPFNIIQLPLPFNINPVLLPLLIYQINNQNQKMNTIIL
eukprot:COSAG05_NODE_5334_length_1204_cov_7.837104_1_plen_225_part_00